MSLLNIAITGINAYQKHLNVIGNNISNANTPGYSRQEVIQSSALSQDTGAGYQGTGVNVDTIRRLTDQFAVSQLRTDTFTFKENEAFRDNVEQINKLLGDERTGLNSALGEFFSALQVASESPGFIPSREALLGAGSIMQDRLNVMWDRLDEQNRAVNGNIGANVSDINALADGIAKLNNEILGKGDQSGRNVPNDLLDKREELIRELSEVIGVDVVDSGDSLDVYIGNGQALVLGAEARRLQVGSNAYDPSQNDVFFIGVNNKRQNITEAISGGQLGGIIEFRNTSLSDTMNSLGRIATSFAQVFNEQQTQGVDLNGEFGKNLFTDYNDPQLARARVQLNENNSRPQTGEASLYIDDISNLTTSNYEVRFVGPRDFGYEVTRVSDGEVVKSGSLSGELPESIRFDGLEMRFEGGEFREGDRMLLQPTRNAAGAFQQTLSRPSELAFASPLTGQGSLANAGTGRINQGEILDPNAQAFEVPGEMNPPLLVVFESELSYSLLDNSDPLRPRNLEPPMRHLPFTPGVANDLIPSNPGETQVTSYSGWLPSVPFRQDGNEGSVWPDNGFNPERVTFETVDEEGNARLLERVSTSKGASAQEVAANLASVPGVSARAFTEVELTNFTNAQSNFNDPKPTEIFLNDFDLTIPASELGDNQRIFDDTVIKEVPSQITPDFLANRINAAWEFKEQGITARSDGTSLFIMAANGDDLRIELKGNSADNTSNELPDSFEVSNGQSVDLRPTGADTRGMLTESRGFDFSERGPYTFEFTTPYGESASIELTENYEDADAMLLGIEQKIEQKLISQERIKRDDPWLNGKDAPGRANVSIDERGNISFKVLMKMEGQPNNDSEKITMGGTVDVIMDEGVRMRTQPESGNLFSGAPEALSTYLGYQFRVDGAPKPGDRFEIDFNQDPSGDNRNAEVMIDFQTDKLLNQQDNGMSFNEAYSQLAEQVGVRTRQAQINTDASKATKEQTEERLQQVAGVNLDEEAARMIRFEQGYNASAQMIKVSQDIFTSLLGAFR